MMNSNEPGQADPRQNPPGAPAPGQPAGGWVQVRYKGQRPYVVYVLIAINVVLYLLQMVSPSFIDAQSLMQQLGVVVYGSDPVALLGMKINELILSGQYWRLLTPMFLHGSIMHIAFNMYALNAIGPELERHYGHLRFLAMYLLSGFVGNIFSFLFSPNPSLGSSTAIFGLLGAEAVFLYHNRSIFGSQARKALMNIATIAGINLVIGLSPGIDNWGHIGGMIGGASFAWVAGPLLQVRGLYPSLTLEDQRESGEILRAALTIGLLWLAFAAAASFVRG